MRDAKIIEMKPCPFCGKTPFPFICVQKGFWGEGLWFIEDTHDDDCFEKFNQMFGNVHFGEAINGEPTESLLKWINRWNKRCNDG